MQFFSQNFITPMKFWLKNLNDFLLFCETNFCHIYMVIYNGKRNAENSSLLFHHVGKCLASLETARETPSNSIIDFRRTLKS